MELTWKQIVPTEADFEFWIKNKLNVLFVGGHGIGKTTMITEAFKKFNLKHRYFSASTMDPWVDFIGVPKEVSDETGEYLELVKPKDFRDDNIQALFFDEYNRAPKKVQNAVMELIQFKSINGRRFDNLEMIWAAINESTEKGTEYNVDKLDPAQLDRFHIIVQLPSKPQIAYFRKTHDDLGEVACKWWDQLSQELKAFISPRRLDYVLDVYKKGGNISYCLPSNANVNTLLTNLKQGLPYNAMVALIKKGDQNKLKNWLNKAVNYDQVEKEIIEKHLSDCFAHLSEEKQTELLAKHTQVRDFVNKNSEGFVGVVKSLRRAKDQKLRSWALSVDLKADEVSLSGFAKWEPGQRKSNLERQAKALSHLTNWSSTVKSHVSKISLSENDNAEITTLIAAIAPNDLYKVTYEKTIKLNLLFKTLSSKSCNTISLSQLDQLVWALNYWMFGFQDTTVNRMLETNKSAKKIIADLLSMYINNGRAFSENPSSLFDSLQYMLVIHDKLKLSWY